MKQKVVVIGHGSTSRLGIVRALSDADCDITVIVMSWLDRKGNLITSKPFDCYSKYINRLFYHFAKDGQGLIQLLLDKCADPCQTVILLPDSDFSAAIIDDNKERLRNSFAFPHIIHEPFSVRYWMDKNHQKRIAAEVGLDFAKSAEIEVKNGSYCIPDGVVYPCFTKPSVSIFAGKSYFKKCDREQELRTLLDSVASKYDETILAEEFINIESEYALLGFSDGTDVVIPGIIKFLENSQSHFGIARKGIIMPIIGFEQLLEKFKQLVLKIGFVGVFDIDFFWGDGKWWFGELNLRFGGSGYAVTKMGVNLPVMLVKYLAGEGYAEMPKKIDHSATYVNERMCRDDWYQGKISTKEYHSIIESSDISFVNDDKDTEPQKVYDKHFARLKAKRIVRLLLKTNR